MYINFLTNNSKLLKLNYLTNNNSYLIGFGKRRTDEDNFDSFEASNSKQKDNNENTKLSEEKVRMILAHYNNPNRKYGDISKFCADNGLTIEQYNKIADKERKRAKKQEEIRSYIAGQKGVDISLRSKWTRISDEMKQKILEHHSSDRGYGDIKKFCLQNGIRINQYNSVVNNSLHGLAKKQNKEASQENISEKKHSGKPQLSPELKELIIEHYKTKRTVPGAVRQFCSEHNIKMYQYSNVVYTKLNPEERAKIQEEVKKISLQRKAEKERLKQERKQKFEELLQAKARAKAEEQKFLSRQREISKIKLGISATKQEMLHAKKLAEQSDNSVVREKNLSRAEALEEKIKKLQEKITCIENGLPFSEPETSEQGYSLFSSYSEKSLENICKLNSADEKSIRGKRKEFYDYIYTQKNDILRVMRKNAHGKSNLENMKNSFEKIKAELEEEMAKYTENSSEMYTLQRLIAFVNNKLERVKSKLDIKVMTQTSLLNQTWLTQEDFKNKLFGHKKLLRVSLDAYADKKEIDGINEKLKQTFPQDIVFWIKDYDVINYGQSSERYEVKYRIYESTDGGKNGYYGAYKTYTLEFASDRKNAYKTLIEKLIEKHKS